MIRLARLDDLAVIVAIYNESIPGRMSTSDLEPITVESRFTWFHEHKENRPLWVYEVDHTIAGWFSFTSFNERCAYQATVEMSVYISERFKKQGIATKLLAHAIQACPSLHISSIVALIFGHNTPSIHLVTRFNFKQWGHLPRVTELDGIERDVVIYGLRVA